LDKLYWFVFRKPVTTKKQQGKASFSFRENIYVPAMADAAPPDEKHCTDEFWRYAKAAYPSQQARNIRDKSNAFTALHSHSLHENRKHSKPALAVSVGAYNRLNEAAYKFR